MANLTHTTHSGGGGHDEGGRAKTFDARLLIQLAGVAIAAAGAYAAIKVDIQKISGDVATFTAVAAEKFRITDATLAKLERTDETLDVQIDNLKESLRKR